VIRRHYELWVGRTALAAGLTAKAREHLGRAIHWRPAFWSAALLWLVARLTPSDRAAASLLHAWERSTRALHRLATDPSAWGDYRRRVFARRVGPADDRSVAAPGL
jgi:hypothetical protein